MILIKSSFILIFSGVFKNVMDRFLGQKWAICPQKWKTEIRKNKARIASFAYACRVRILEPEIK